MSSPPKKAKTAKKAAKKAPAKKAAKKAAVTPWVPQESDDRLRVMEMLNYKAAQLQEQVALLTSRLSIDDDAATLFEWQMARSAARDERDYCLARVQALLGGGGFRRPSATQEQALLDSIQEVGEAAEENAALRAIITEFMDVVYAYGAVSTKPLS